LKSCLEIDFSIGNDFINQKAHPESEEKGDDVFQDESEGLSHSQQMTKTVTLNEGNSRCEDHTHE
jgi:hypothetical protein